jgi:hypothetical protein
MGGHVNCIETRSVAMATQPSCRRLRLNEFALWIHFYVWCDQSVTVPGTHRKSWRPDSESPCLIKTTSTRWCKNDCISPTFLPFPSFNWRSKWLGMKKELQFSKSVLTQGIVLLPKLHTAFDG